MTHIFCVRIKCLGETVISLFINIECFKPLCSNVKMPVKYYTITTKRQELEYKWAHLRVEAAENTLQHDG